MEYIPGKQNLITQWNISLGYKIWLHSGIYPWETKFDYTVEYIPGKQNLITQWNISLGNKIWIHSGIYPWETKFDYTVEYIPGKQNLKADALERNRNARVEQPPSRFESHIYSVEADDIYTVMVTAVLDDVSFTERLKGEQIIDERISEMKDAILLNGRFKRVRNQLRIDDEILYSQHLGYMR